MRRDFEGAVAKFTAALHADPADAEAFAGRADAFAALDRLGPAADDYTRALELRPDLVRARFNRAVAYRLTNRLSDALADMNRVIDEQSDAPGPVYNRGLVYLAQGEFARSAADFGRTLALEPGHAGAVAKRREAYRLQREAAAVAPPAAAPPAEPVRKPEAGPAAGVLQVRCPGCAAEGGVRWDKLGRVLACPRCTRWYRLSQHGTLVEVVSTPAGWADKTAVASPPRSASRRWAGGWHWRRPYSSGS